jgi:hypothetical protein
MPEADLRPREYCELAKLSSRKKRRVSNKAHGSIEWLHERLWDAMIEADPEPEQFERKLYELALQMDLANGPSTALAGQIIADWRWARESPRYTAWLRSLHDRREGSRERKPSPRAAGPSEQSSLLSLD